MLDLNTLALGFILLFVGIALFLLIRVFLRTLPSPSISAQEPPPPPMLSIPNGHNQDALFVVQPGGRVIYTNQTAREWFEIPLSKQPNLEHLARRARPKDVFLHLCAAEGQARFSLSGIFLEGTSYVLPYPDQQVVVVTLRRPQLTSLTGGGTDLPRGEIDIFSELSQEMTASLNLETTLKAVLENVNHLVPSDFSEITLWDHYHKYLIPYRFVSLSGVDRQLETTTERYQVNDGFSGYLISKQTPLLIGDVDQFQTIQPAIDRQRFPIKSFLGIPLLIAGEPTGTLELASLRTQAFTQNDLEILKILSGQAAVAIHNARIHEQEQERVAELSGLATLAQATSALGDPKDLYDRLIASVSPLLDVEILGLLIYDEPGRILEGKKPFIGVPDQFVDLYRTPIHMNSPAERVWLSNEMIVTTDAREDDRLIDLGLAHLAQAASIENTALIPLPASGRMLGYLQAANKRDGTNLTDDDLRLLAIIAGQIGPIIENATLVQESRRRARQAEAMRRITSLAGSGATLDEILKFSLLELARLLNAEVAGIFLLDPNQRELHLHKGSLFGIPHETAESIERLPIDDPQFRQTVTGSLQPFISNDVGVDERILSIYRPLIEALGSIRSVIDVPLEVRENGIGEIILGSQTETFFGTQDAQIASTAARQLASAIERSSLYTQTDENLRREIDHLTSLNRIHRELNTTLDISHMVEFLHQECLHLSQANHCAILLLDPARTGSKRTMIRFAAGTTEVDTFSAAEQTVIDTGESIQIADYSESPYDPPEGEIVSSLIVPIKNQSEILGIIHLYTTDPEWLNSSVIKAIEAIGTHAGSAVNNALLYQNLNQQTDQLTQERNSLSALLEFSGPDQDAKTRKQRFEIIARSIQASSPFDLVLISEYEPTQKFLQVVTGVGISAESLLSHLTENISWEAIVPLFVPEFRLSDSYFIPAAMRPELDIDSPFFPEVDLSTDLNDNSWQTGDLLLTPLLDADGNPLGLIRFDRPRNGLPPDLKTVEALEIFTGQSAVSIETSRKIERLEERITDLQIESTRAIQAHEVAKGNLPILLHKDLAQTITIRRLNHRAQRIRAGLDIAEIVNLQPDRSAVLWALGQEMLTRMNLDIALVADFSAGGPRLLHSLGSISPDTNTEALLGQRNPLRLSLKTGETLLIPDLEEDENWKNTPLLQAIQAKGFICMPISTNGKTDAAVLAVSQEPLPPFNEEDKQIYSLLASQVSITLQNLSLLTETRRRLREVGLLLEFSRQLGSLDPDEILRTLINSTLRVISNAHAGVVCIWDEGQSQLIPKAASGYTDNQLITEITYRNGEALPGLIYSSGKPMRVNEVNFAEQYKLPSENLLRYREATGGRVPVSSLLVPLQAGELTLGVLVLDNFNTPAAFTADDEALITSLTQQTALAMENARLFQASEQRTHQLRSLTDMAATITSSLQIDELIASLLDHLSSVLPHNTATLWIREENQLSIRAARGFDDPDQQVGLTVSVEDSQLLSEMIASGQPINVENVHADARFPALIEHPHLSWLGIPLITKGDVAGVIALEKTEPSFYSYEHVQIATTLAGQTAVALENARLFEDSLRRTQDLDQRSQRLNLLNRISTELSESLDPDQILHFTVQELRQALRGSTVSLLIFDETGNPILQGETPPQESDYPALLPEIPLFDYLKQTLGMYTTEDITNKEEFTPWKQFFETRKTRALLALPLATGNDLHGLVFIHSTQPIRFPPSEVDLARTITNQAAIAFQNARLFAKTKEMTAELERRVAERTKELEEEHQRTQILLNIITELSASLDLDIVVNRTLALINEISGAEQSTVLLVKPEESAFLFLASHGYTVPPAEGGQMTWLSVDEGLAGWVLSEQKAALIHDLTEDERWIVNAERPSNHRSALAVPLLVGPEALGVLMLFHRQPKHFSADQLDLIQATAKQIAVAINNAQLYLLIRDQAERLGSMLRTQQIEASRSRAILESVADGVLVTDINDFISLFNASAEEITSLKGDQVVGKSLDDFIGLFGGAAQAWMQTIHTWSEDPSTYSPGEIFTEQIELEDGRVVAVSLAPVILRDELLGTVSIFRDITHQVEVDRLKSEFVATVSHELRTPMTSIKGYVEVLLLGAAGELNPQQSEFLQTVQNNTERLNILVNDLLDVSRIEAGKTTFLSQPLAIDKIAEEVVASLIRRSRNENKPMNIVLTTPPDLPPAVGDKDLLNQILSKLVDNAYNYTPSSGHITVSMQAHEHEIQVDIQDTGIGIAKSDQERVFDRFYRGEDPLVLATAGTGLGLSIVKQLVEMHNGRLWMKSSGVHGEGSTFSFTLPVYQVDKEA